MRIASGTPTLAHGEQVRLPPSVPAAAPSITKRPFHIANDMHRDVEPRPPQAYDVGTTTRSRTAK
jgi:hypothetical protein